MTFKEPAKFYAKPIDDTNLEMESDDILQDVNDDFDNEDIQQQYNTFDEEILGVQRNPKKDKGKEKMSIDKPLSLPP